MSGRAFGLHHNQHHCVGPEGLFRALLFGLSAIFGQLRGIYNVYGLVPGILSFKKVLIFYFLEVFYG